MEYDSSLCPRHIMFSIILLLFAATSSAQPIDYDDVVNLLPMEPKTKNDTLAAIVQDPVVQDAVQDAVGSGPLEGLVVKKKVLIMPAIEPTKVVSQREQVLVVPMTNLEDVRKNITESANEETDKDGLVQLFTQNGEKGSHEDENDPFDMSQRVDFHEVLDEFFETTSKPIDLPINGDNAPPEIPYLLPNPEQKMERPEDYQPHHPPPTISVPIIAFLDPTEISDDKIDVPIAATLSEIDDTTSSRLDLLENNRDEIQRNVQDYIDSSTLSVDSDYWRLTSSPSQTPLLYEPATMENQYASDVRPEASLPIAVPRIDIVAPLFWTSDADIDYPKDSRDMDTAAHIVFRPLFRFRQEGQRRSYGSLPYRNSYNPYPRRNYGYRPRYYGDYYQ
ncbi:uncharacterized protein LOC116849220 isoform X1 [Odontomachus brunneus]|uniref:uncharacterized protein LOC116849220 isoform X1 n=1 Tax=Odontomachus brunneus TaxID=486640 RepID=UPI0013F2AF99|nr:uncharacterized protein LOC116849220 isoform X1 [Odontomachus brunneus]